MGERLLRKLQWTDARRITQRRNLLLPAGGPNHHRKMEEPLKHKTPLIDTEYRLPGNGTHSALGYRPPAPEAIVLMDQKPIMH